MTTTSNLRSTSLTPDALDVSVLTSAVLMPGLLRRSSSTMDHNRVGRHSVRRHWRHLWLMARPFCGNRLHRWDKAAVDEVVRSGDVRGAVAGEEDDKVANFLGSGESSSRGVAHRGLRDVLRGGSGGTGHGGC